MAAAEPAQAPQAHAEYDEAQCISALAQLEKLQDQLDDLRFTLPRIVEPYHLPSKPPMFHAFKSNLTNAQRGMKAFRSQWHNQDTQSILEHTRKSATANSDLSASAQVQQYGWIDKEEREKEAATEKAGGEENMEDVRVHITRDERERIVGTWKKAHPVIKTEEGDEGRILVIPFVADSTKYRFRVTISDDPDSTQSISAECEGAGEYETAVTRCVAARPNENDLKYLLDMIAAYRSVKGIRCAKCNKMLDDDTTRPVARRSRQVDGANATAETVWEPFHEGCLA